VAAAADEPVSGPSADEMIAALATRPARKPRAPKTRTRKPAAPPASAPEADAETPPPVVATEPPAPAPSAAAGLGARLLRLFARAPRQPAAAQVASPDAAAVPTPSPSPDPAEATPATPALSIRNRRKRSTRGIESPPETAGPAAAPIAGDGPVSTVVVSAAAEAASVAATPPAATSDALPATIAPVVDIDPAPPAAVSPAAVSPATASPATASPAAASPAAASPAAASPAAASPADALPADALPADAPPVAMAPRLPPHEAPGKDRGEIGSDNLSVSGSGPTDASVTPPENIDAAAAALVAAMPATTTAADTLPLPARAAPSFATTRATTARSRRDYRAVGAALALTLALGLQLLLAQRAVLAADPGWRPAITALCGLLRCALPPWREPAAFTMLNRHVRPHPDAPGTLLIDASFRNDARWPQPWPRLELTLSDVDGRTVGARTFDASEYLGVPPAQPELAPGQSASLSLAVVEPAPDIVSFTFDFR
jgi:hypothetical protein